MPKLQKLATPQNPNAKIFKGTLQSPDMLNFKETDEYIDLHNKCCFTIANIDKDSIPSSGIRVSNPVFFRQISRKIKLFSAIADEFERAGWIVLSSTSPRHFQGLRFYQKRPSKH